MERIKANDAMKELTVMLMYLSRFSERDRFSDSQDYYAWKGYDFDILNSLDDDDFIRQGSHPSRSKSVYITDSGIAFAKKLLDKYGINDWEK